MSDPMAVFRARFAARMRDDLPMLQAAAAGEPQAELQIKVHRMAGLAGSIGYPEIGKLAAQVDAALDRNGSAPQALLQRLVAAAESIANLP